MRRAAPEDAQRIAAVFDAAIGAAWTWLGPLAHEPLFTAQDWDRLVADHAPPNLLLVAEDEAGERACGFVAAHPGDGELFLLFVHPEHAGQGIGSRLLAAAHDGLRAGGARQAFLFVHERNARAIGVYERAGYRPDGAHRDAEFRGVTTREIRLVMPLQPGPSGATGPT